MNAAAPRTALVVSGVSVRYGSRIVVNDLSLSLDAGEAVALVGPSGSGKTSVLSAILGLIPHEGRVTIGGRELTKRSAISIRRHDIGMVYQHGELMDELSASENVALGSLVTGEHRATADEDAARLLDQLGVAQGTLAAQLSGGERQRVALARALVKKPSLVLADEPTGSLDERTRDDTAALLFETVRKQGAALLIVTHDVAVARRADRVIEIEPQTVQKAQHGGP